MGGGEIYLFVLYVGVFGQNACLRTRLVPVEVRRRGTGVTDSCVPPRGFWELSSSPVGEQPVLFLTVEPSLQPQGVLFCFVFETGSLSIILSVLELTL